MLRIGIRAQETRENDVVRVGRVVKLVGGPFKVLRIEKGSSAIHLYHTNVLSVVCGPDEFIELLHRPLTITEDEAEGPLLYACQNVRDAILPQPGVLLDESARAQWRQNVRSSTEMLRSLLNVYHLGTSQQPDTEAGGGDHA